MQRVKILATDQEAFNKLLAQNMVIDFAQGTPLTGGRMSIPASLTNEEIDFLKAEGFAVEIVEPVQAIAARAYRMINRDRYEDSSIDKHDPRTPYDATVQTPDWIDGFLRDMQSRFPKYISLLELPNRSWGDRVAGLPSRSIYAALLRAPNPQPSRRGVLFLGSQHADEWVSADICTNFIWFMLSSMDTQTDLVLGGKTFTYWTIKELMEALDIYVIPVVNPDGKIFSMNPANGVAGLLWRKNRRPPPSAGSAKSYGVDLNRNYDFLFSKYNGPPFITSNDPTARTYKGPDYFSEPETKNVRWMIEQRRNIQFLMDVHGNVGKILYPWGLDDDQWRTPDMNFRTIKYDDKRGYPTSDYQEFINYTDLDFYQKTGDKIRNSIREVRGMNYVPTQSFRLYGPDSPSVYPTIASADDYAYHLHMVDRTKQKIFAYTLEYLNMGTMVPGTHEELLNICWDCCAALVEYCNAAFNAPAQLLSTGTAEAS